MSSIFLFLSFSMHIFILNFLQISKLYILTMEVNTYLICFRIIYKFMISSQNGLIIKSLNKMGWLKERTLIYLMLYVPFY